MSEPTYRIAQRLHARRAAVGLPKYGQHLTADSPGCMLVHALQESADKTNYLIAEVQRRRKLLLDLAEWTSDLDGVEGAEYVRAEMILTYLDLGGQAALASYDEILGGAEDATVALLPKDAEADAAFSAVRGDEAEATIERVHGPKMDPRDEALRVATEALCDARDQIEALCSADDVPDSVHTALAAIRGAR